MCSCLARLVCSWQAGGQVIGTAGRWCWCAAGEWLTSGWRAADEQLARATCWQELVCSKQPVSSWCAVASGWRVGKEERLVCCWRVAHERLASGWRAVGEQLASGQHAGTGVRLARSWRAAG